MNEGEEEKKTDHYAHYSKRFTLFPFSFSVKHTTHTATVKFNGNLLEETRKKEK